MGLPEKFERVNHDTLEADFREILNDINKDKDGISSCPLSISVVNVKLETDGSFVWESEIGCYWMDIDSHGISVDILDVDSSQGNTLIFMDFKKCRDYSYDKKILKVSMDELSSDLLQNLGKVNVTLTLSDESLGKCNLLKGVLNHHSIVKILF
jgi:hypothetical protein